MDFKNTLKPGSTKEKFTIKDLISKALNLLVFVDLNNPIIIFKCDQQYINDRISIFNGDNDNVRNKSSENSERDAFMKMMTDVDPFTDKDFERVEAEKRAALLNHNKFPTEIIDYTDTLNTWVSFF